MMYTDVKIAWKVKLFFQRARNGYNYLKKKIIEVIHKQNCRNHMKMQIFDISVKKS